MIHKFVSESDDWRLMNRRSIIENPLGQISPANMADAIIVPKLGHTYFIMISFASIVFFLAYEVKIGYG